MITLFVLFLSLYIVCAILKLVFKVTFRLLKWIILASLTVAGYLLAAAFAVPMMLVIPGIVILFLLTCFGGKRA